MPSIIRYGDTYHGISVDGRGVFTNDEHGRRTYAGQHRDGYACGLGVTTWSNGYKNFAEYGPDGQYNGRCLDRWAAGGTEYRLYERGGTRKAFARVFADDGSCVYNNYQCAPDDPRVLALIAQVAPVEVRRSPSPPPAIATPLAPRQSSDVPARFATGARGYHGHRGASPRHTPSLVAVRHIPTAAAMHSPTTNSERTGLA